jgi:hypothetical protein
MIGHRASLCGVEASSCPIRAFPRRVKGSTHRPKGSSSPGRALLQSGRASISPTIALVHRAIAERCRTIPGIRRSRAWLLPEEACVRRHWVTRGRGKAFPWPNPVACPCVAAAPFRGTARPGRTEGRRRQDE